MGLLGAAPADVALDEEPLHGLGPHAKDAADTHRFEVATVNEAANRLGMHAKAIGDLAHRMEAGRNLLWSSRHSNSFSPQVLT